MPTSALAQIGSGLSEAFFGGHLKQQQDDQDQSNKEQALRLAALQSLLHDPHTQEQDVPNILAAMAKEVKAEKEFAPVIAHMNAGMQQRVASGDPRETGQSIAARVIAGGVGPNANADRTTTVAGPGSLTLRPTTAVPGEPGNYMPAMEAAFQGGAIPASSAPTEPLTSTVTTPALRAVPPEPVLFQPTKSLGQMTQQEVADMRERKKYEFQQKELTEKESQRQHEMLERQLTVRREANAGAMARLQANNTAKVALLSEAEKLRAHRDIAKLTEAGYSPEDAADIIQQGIEDKHVESVNRTALLKARSDAIPVQLRQKWEALDQGADRLDISKWRAQIYGQLATNKVDATQFDKETKDMFDELAEVRKAKQNLLKRPDLLNGGQYGKDHPEYQQELDRLTTQEKGIADQIKLKRDQMMSPVTVPQAPPGRTPRSRAPAGAPPKSDPLGLFK